MKLIIAGSRNITLEDGRETIDELLNCFENLKYPTELVCGMCPTGVDNIAIEWLAMQENYDPPHPKLVEFPADWQTHGRAAGPIRNREMAKYADVLFLIWDGESRGSKNMKEEMLKLNKPVYEVILKKYNEKVVEPEEET